MRKGYFDNAATTLVKPEGMYEFVSNYMLNNGINVGRSNTDKFSSGSIVNETRELFLKLVHAPQTKTVVFLPSATIALNTIINGLDIKEKDNVFISPFEHNAVTRTLLHRQKSVGFHILQLKLPNDVLQYDLTLVEKQFIEKRPKVLIVSHVSNVLGLIAPIPELSKLAKKYGATVVVDGSQGCGVVDIIVDNKIDYYIFAGHKTLLAPFGVGGFICNTNTTLPAFIYGGTGIDSANNEMPHSIPERFEAGSLNIMSIVGLNYSLKWIMENYENIRDREERNLIRLEKLLEKYDYIKTVKVHGEKISMISCAFDSLTSDEAGRVLSEHGVIVRTGLHCAPYTHKFLKTFPEGLVRFSVSCFTNDYDFAQLEYALDKIGEDL